MSPAVADRLISLQALLTTHDVLYRERPFVSVPLLWETRYPELSAALRGLTQETVSAYENEPLELPAVLNAIPQLAAQIRQLSMWPRLDRASLPDLPMPKRIPLKKWRQITRFVATVSAAAPPHVERYVDWCSGKGHLGSLTNRTLSLPVTCVEKDKALCDTGMSEARIRGADLQFVCADVLGDIDAGVLDDTSGILALHACGHLNLALLQKGVAANVPFMAVVPCCYQRIDGMDFHPLSSLAQRHPVPLTRHLLRLPSLDDNLSGTAERRRRHKEHTYRLGLDLLVRKALGQNVYTPLGAVKPSLLKTSFEAFAQTTAKEHRLPLPLQVDWKKAEQQGAARYHLASALGLARALFRRAIESYLVLDRIAYLEENGYQVKAGTFCSREITPRNIMILAYGPKSKRHQPNR